MKRYEDFVALHERFNDGPRRTLRTLWWTGFGCAVVAAGLAFAAVLGLRGLGVGVPVFAGDRTGDGAAAGSYALCALAGTVQATALMHLLLAGAARPVRAFGWIAGTGVVLLTLLPLVLRGPWGAAVATAALNLCGGVAVTGLLAAAVAASARRRPPWPDGSFSRDRW